MNGGIIAYWCLQAAGLAIMLVRHGEETKTSFPIGLVGLIITQTLLYLVGAFN